MSRRVTAVVLGTLALVLPLSACGNGSSSSSTRTPASSSTTGAPQTSPTQTTGSVPSTNGAATAFLPARFTVNADGSLSPPLVAGPAGTAVLLTVSSRAAHPVRVVLAGHSLNVPAGGSASMRIVGLRVGRYPIEVDGRRGAALVVGAQPGP